ncbi:bifunctional phosphoglucose/phosphomannose isomerase [Rhizohabitans arisaemae]|uniref:bifunctional phosphoglucose/phosphomannose isomerase n=1 Tax=Rhizohabitans arisaemae TaxID=2720610 RepID=UPI0024B26FE5|nr:bifunctional phosphoglucose/phosphomannose isomerase [Rhizohabitans arisaemae]
MIGFEETSRFDTARFDDDASRSAGDPSGMLRAVASSAAQVRESYRNAMEAGVGSLAEMGRPRSIVVAGMGGSAISGDVLAAVCGTGCPIPIVPVRSYRLPGWVGAADLVMAVSCSGRTEETLITAREAVRRGSRLMAVGRAGSPLAQIAAQARGLFVPVTAAAGQPRATFWGLTVPLIAAARRLGLAQVDEDVYETTAKQLEAIAHRCRPGSDGFINPGKTLAARIAGSIPMVWGTSPLAAAAAYRFSCQLNENAKYPAIWGEIPEAQHNQIVAFDGPLVGRDFGPQESVRLSLVLLRDTDEHPQVVKRREALTELARDRGVPVHEIVAEGTHPLERLASLVCLGDFASVYLGIGYGIDPTPVEAIEEIKSRITR